MVSDSDRRDLFAALEAELGRGPATTLMELLPPVGWADVARQSDLVAIRGEMAELRGEIAELRGELKAEMAELRTELKGEMAELRTELKDEMAELRAEINGLVPKFLVGSVPIVFGTAGLVLAAVKLV